MKRSARQKSASTSVDLVALAECVEQFSSKTIVLFGDFVADEFQYGEISRVSREAPVLILKHRETQLVPGGGANAANNLASLGARVLPVTAVGDDSAGDALIAYFRRKKVCRFCVDKADYIDYKKAEILAPFIQERGKILPRRMTGTCSRHQRWLTVAIKRAQNIALLPFAAEL